MFFLAVIVALGASCWFVTELNRSRSDATSTVICGTLVVLGWMPVLMLLGAVR